MVAQIIPKSLRPHVSGQLTHAVRDEFGLIQVIDTETSRSLYFDSPVEQSRLYFKAPMTLAFEYQTQILKLIANYSTQHRVHSTLTLGLGGGTLINHLYCLLPKASHFAIELRQQVIDIAYEYFYLTQHPNIFPIQADAAQIIAETDAADIIIVDLYDEQAMPSAFCQPSFLTDLLAKKKTPGLILFNLWTSTSQKTLKVLEFWQKKTNLNVEAESTVSSGNIILSIQ